MHGTALAASLVLSVPQIALTLAALGLVSSFFGPAQSVALRTLVALGILLSCVLADRLGIRQLFLACGTLVIVLAAAGWLFLRPRPAESAAP